MKVKPPKERIVYVEWIDATTQAGWFEVNKADVKCLPLTSCGFLVVEDTNQITLSHTMSPDLSINGYMSIPKGWIRKRRNVKL